MEKWNHMLMTRYFDAFKGDFTLYGILAECRCDIAFFLVLHMRKSFFTNGFLKCRFRLKVEIISSFPLRTNVAFFLNQSF